MGIRKKRRIAGAWEEEKRMEIREVKKGRKKGRERGREGGDIKIPMTMKNH